MIEQTQTLLKENGIDKIYFYNIKTPVLNNTMTVCILKRKDKIETRGVSICSLLDSFNITKGKHIALGRAIKSLKRKENFFKINGCGRNDEHIKRQMKIKTELDDKNFKMTIAPELNSIKPAREIKIQIDVNAKFIKKYIFDLPLSYPMQTANNFFRYKAQYRPDPATDAEFALLNREELAGKAA